MTSQELLTEFRNNFFAVYFTEIPDTIVNPAIAEVVSLMDSTKVLNSCPTLYSKYVVLNSMLLIHDSGLTSDAGSVVVPDLNSSTGLVVQSDKVADTSRTFFKPEKLADSEHGVLSNVRSQISDIEKVCLVDDSKKGVSRMYGFVGGSNYTQNNSIDPCSK